MARIDATVSLGFCTGEDFFIYIIAYSHDFRLLFAYNSQRFSPATGPFFDKQINMLCMFQGSRGKKTQWKHVLIWSSKIGIGLFDIGGKSTENNS